jgi:hypothetical protein
LGGGPTPRIDLCQTLLADPSADLRIKPWKLNCGIDSRSARKILPARSNTIEALPAATAILMETSDEWETGRAYFSDPSKS